ncbi:uncharacterized protein THITE_2112307 [Thermothielavioides terrestris NRRL 8126]|uniref:Glutaredoxin domain-containing protein n=1 Tax=Thermothielavioides terrestris (strain ATCC 38088 / NRRL 8126) TaxID=578455 RepID=G2QYI9_THETT|nr:uncharacterized protein THITE_2112307 [Thermothielavioides terrestris NRRL 8126]AEO65377.1 hypothetical protein THITE_2112307 [Thermothielavioides terrestris NRRL 8126]
MPSPRRLRVLVYLVFAGFVTLLFFTSRARHAREADTRSLRDFYSKTAAAIDKAHGETVMAKHDVDADGDIDADDDVLAREMAARLRQAEQRAKDSAEAKGPSKPDPPEKVIGVGSAAKGQERGGPKAKAEVEVKESEEEDPEVEVQLNDILKKAPVIIFSKSYCPYSKRAKGILLEKYVIEPTPYVVELDLHPLGPKIQARLGEMTGRKTVPNIMVYGKSIGGGDDIAALDREKALADKITSLGGSRVQVSERFVGSSQKKD